MAQKRTHYYHCYYYHYSYLDTVSGGAVMNVWFSVQIFVCLCVYLSLFLWSKTPKCGSKHIAFQNWTIIVQSALNARRSWFPGGRFTFADVRNPAVIVGISITTIAWQHWLTMFRPFRLASDWWSHSKLLSLAASCWCWWFVTEGVLPPPWCTLLSSCNSQEGKPRGTHSASFPSLTSWRVHLLTRVSEGPLSFRKWRWKWRDSSFTALLTWRQGRWSHARVAYNFSSM